MQLRPPLSQRIFQLPRVFTAYRALVTVGGRKRGDKVLIHGASGGVGVACLQIGKFLGMEVHRTASTDAGLSLITEHDCHAYNHRQEGFLGALNEHKAGFFAYLKVGTKSGKSKTVFTDCRAFPETNTSLI